MPASREPVTEADRLRDPAGALQPDPRQKGFVILGDEGFRPVDFAHHHGAIQVFRLNLTAPHAIRVHFETAKNLCLYAWFVYRFFPVAQQHALATLEFALRERLQALETVPKRGKVPRGLSGLLRRARDCHLISNEGLRIRNRAAIQSARERRTFEAIATMEKSGVTEMILDDTVLATPEPQDFSDHWIDAFLAGLPKIRNEIAHGSRYLNPSVLATFETVCDLVNQLYPETE